MRFPLANYLLNHAYPAIASMDVAIISGALASGDIDTARSCVSEVLGNRLDREHADDSRFCSMSMGA